MSESPTDPDRLSADELGSGSPDPDSHHTGDTRPQHPEPYPAQEPDRASTHVGSPGRPTDQPTLPTGVANQTRPSLPQRPAPPTRAQPAQAPAPYAAPRRSQRGTSLGGLLLRGLILAVIAVVLLSLLAISTSVVGYLFIASELPSPEELQSRSFTFASSEIYDRNGNLLWELIDPSAGRRTWVPLARVSPYAQQATIATEDRFFYQNVGVDPIAIARAVYYNVTEGEIVSGGSTITQQLAKNVLLSPEERTEQSFSRKIREAVLATELFRRYPKDKILEIYLNQIYYGNLAYGIQAASQTYFGKPATDLTLAEAALLAGLPQLPAIYDPFVNLKAAKTRQKVVLDLMVEAGYITPAQAGAAYAEELEFVAPHPPVARSSIWPRSAIPGTGYPCADHPRSPHPGHCRGGSHQANNRFARQKCHQWCRGSAQRQDG
jgi:hypothetical protein